MSSLNSERSIPVPPSKLGLHSAKPKAKGRHLGCLCVSVGCQEECSRTVQDSICLLDEAMPATIAPSKAEEQMFTKQGNCQPL